MDLTLKVWRQENSTAKGKFEKYQIKNIKLNLTHVDIAKAPDTEYHGKNLSLKIKTKI